MTFIKVCEVFATEIFLSYFEMFLIALETAANLEKQNW